MATEEEKQAYIDDRARKRGYVLDYQNVIGLRIISRPR